MKRTLIKKDGRLIGWVTLKGRRWVAKRADGALGQIGQRRTFDQANTAVAWVLNQESTQ